MPNTRSAIAALVVVSALAVGCNRGEPEAPPAQAQTQTSNTLNTPATITGCLRAGEAGDTFVLTTSRTGEGAEPATYELAGSGGVNLQDHIGSRVEVSGVISDQQHIATRESPQVADQKATGTAGTPTVQSSTQLAVRRLEVKSVRRVDGSCE